MKNLRSTNVSKSGVMSRIQATLPMMLVAFIFASVPVHAVIWNLDTSKTASVFSLDTGATAEVQTDPIDLGENGGEAYLSIPFFSFQMTGFTSGAEITSVDSFSLTLNLSFPVGTPDYNASLYIWQGNPGNPDLATTGTVDATDFRYPNDNAYNVSIIQEAFFTPSSTTGSPTAFSLNATGRANLLSYLQANYVADEYLTFTMRTLTPSDPNFSAYSKLYRMGNGPDITGQLSAVPEPSTFAALAIGLGMMLLIRRSRSSRSFC